MVRPSYCSLTKWGPLLIVHLSSSIHNKYYTVHVPLLTTLVIYYGAIITELLILIVEHNHYSIATEHSTYSAIMYYTSIMGARFGMHAQCTCPSVRTHLVESAGPREGGPSRWHFCSGLLSEHELPYLLSTTYAESNIVNTSCCTPGQRSLWTYSCRSSGSPLW